MVHIISRLTFINFSRACTFLTLFCICILFYRLAKFLGLRTSVYHTDFCSEFKPFSLIQEEIFFDVSSSFNQAEDVTILDGQTQTSRLELLWRLSYFAYTYNEIAVRLETVTQNTTCTQEI